jgi:hypothetical protein
MSMDKVKTWKEKMPTSGKVEELMRRGSNG